MRRKFTLSVSLFIWSDTNRRRAAFQTGRRVSLMGSGAERTRRRPRGLSQPGIYPVCPGGHNERCVTGEGGAVWPVEGGSTVSGAAPVGARRTTGLGGEEVGWCAVAVTGHVASAAGVLFPLSWPLVGDGPVSSGVYGRGRSRLPSFSPGSPTSAWRARAASAGVRR